jgi:ADP-ribosylglycohydrolase
MKLTKEQTDRAAGVLLGCGVGDALGVPYEFQPHQLFAPEDLPLGMPGGGPFNFAPGEWSDDTQMTLCVARAAFDGHDLTSKKGLNRVAKAFGGWYRGGPKDVGGQVSSVLATAERKDATGLVRRARERYENLPDGSAGNGSLMRTSVVALRHLADPEKMTRAARAVSALTHADPDCLDACVVWCHVIRRAVLDGDPRAGLADGLAALRPGMRVNHWLTLASEAEMSVPWDFARNGWVVHAFQAAWAAVTLSLEHGTGFEGGVTWAVACGHDTDTVGAIAGAALGATYGRSGIRPQWVAEVRGWPCCTGADLARIGVHIADLA